MEPFKNWINADKAAQIALAMERSYSDFPRRRFLKNLTQELASLELKERVSFLERRLSDCLPAEPRISFPILTSALKQGEDDKTGLSGFSVWPLTQYVATHGLEDLRLSMDTLLKMTQVFTAEFDVRPFLIQHEVATLEILKQWTKHPNEHVRRLVSEGSRPLLPWGKKLLRVIEAPDLTWPLLERLKDDPSLYVRKSVANHINDHSKYHPDWVIKNLGKWRKEGSLSQEHEWILRHGTRTLVKKGHVGALKLHGVSTSSIKLLKYRILTPKVKLGDYLEVEVKVQNQTRSSASLILDHDLQLLGARGTLRSKVFKGRKCTLAGGEILSLLLKIPIRAVTVRTYYSGRQFWRVIINGQKAKPKAFELMV